MNPKSRDASVSDRLEHIKNERGLDAALRMVNEKRLGASQKEAEAWASKQHLRRYVPRLWGVVVGLAGIIGTIASVFALFP